MNKELNKFEIKSRTSWRPAFFIYTFTVLLLGYIICIPGFFYAIKHDLYELINIFGLIILLISFIGFLIYFFEGRRELSIFAINKQKIYFFIPNKLQFTVHWEQFDTIVVNETLEIIDGGIASDLEKSVHYYELEFIGNNFKREIRFKASNYEKRDFSKRRSIKILKLIKQFAYKKDINKDFKEGRKELIPLYSP